MGYFDNSSSYYNVPYAPYPAYEDQGNKLYAELNQVNQIIQGNATASWGSPTSTQAQCSDSGRFDIPVASQPPQPKSRVASVLDSVDSSTALSVLEGPLELHMNGKRVWGCPYRPGECSTQPMSRWSNMNQHIKSKHASEPLFTCEICQEHFTRKNDKKRRMEEQHSVRS